MKQYFFNLNSSPKECEVLYVPGINSVVMTAESGERVQLPCVNLRPHVSHMGIKGRFRMVIDQYQKIQSFERVS